MLLMTLLAQAGNPDNNLGTLDAPIEAFAPESTTGVDAANVVERIISMGMGAVTIVGSLYFLLVVVVAGFNWLSASGDSGKVKKARDSMIQGLIGMVILVGAYAIIGVIGSIFGLTLLNPGQMLLELGPNP